VAQIAITVNGEPRELPGEVSVIRLLQHLALPADRVAVELNKRLIRKRDWEQTAVGDGATLEIVEFVGGG
jgi:thiamine biosynthesis protein ThiS